MFSSSFIFPKKIKQIWSERQIIWQLIVHEVQSRYRASFLGILWSFVIPLSTIAIYTFVFSVVIRSAWQNAGQLPYALILFAGLIPFNLFSDALNQSPGLVLRHPNYIKKVVFPLHILPIVMTGSLLVDTMISYLLLLGGVLIFTQTLSLTVLLLPFIYLPLLLLILGLSWFLSSLGVYIRDVAPAVGIFTRLWFFVTPIVYPLDAVPATYRWLLALNPLTFFVSAVRDVVLWGKAFSWLEWAAWMACGLLAAGLGFLWFEKTRKGFADVL